MGGADGSGSVTNGCPAAAKSRRLRSLIAQRHVASLVTLVFPAVTHTSWTDASSSSAKTSAESVDTSATHAGDAEARVAGSQRLPGAARRTGPARGVVGTADPRRERVTGAPGPCRA